MLPDPAQLREVQRIIAFWAPEIDAYAFGSRVHGRALKPTSDLDICLRGSAPVDAKILRQVRDAFEISDLPMRVDVVDWHALSVEFQAAIAADLTPVVVAKARRDRQVYRVGEIPEHLVALIRQAEPPEEAKVFDSEYVDKTKT